MTDPTAPNTTRLNAVWATLCAVTAASWWLGHDTGSAASAPLAMTVLALALLKVRLIVQQFMEVQAAPVWLRRCTDGWLVVFWTALLALYLA